MNDPAHDVRVVPIARLRRALHRRRTRWIALAAVALTSALWTMQAMSAADRTVHRWGSTTQVIIATDDLEPGDVIGSDDVVSRTRPIEVVPDGVVDEDTDAVIGRTVTTPIAKGEIILERRLAEGATNGPAALLGTGAIAFAVPTDHSTPALRIGDHVDVFAPSTPTSSRSPTGAGATRIAHRATVVATDDRSVMIGVDATQASALARALLDTAVVMALTE